MIAPSPEIQALVRQRAKKFRTHLAEVPDFDAPLVALKGLNDEHLIYRVNWRP